MVFTIFKSTFQIENSAFCPYSVFTVCNAQYSYNQRKLFPYVAFRDCPS